MHPRFRFLAVRLSLLTLDVSLVIAGVIGVLSLLGRSEVAFAATTRYVAPAGIGVDISDCTSLPCRTIQYAVDQAVNGDTILVATGIYTSTNMRPRNDIVATGSVTQAVYITKTLTLRGGYTMTNWVTSYPITQPTTIDAQNKGRGVYIVGGAAVTLQGFRITRGNANGLGGGLTTSDHAGGGVYAHNASLNLIDNTIFSNTAEAGGGVYLNTIVLCFICTGNSIITNTATISGGGLYIKDSNSALFVSNAIRANSSITEGGGIFFDNSDAILQENTIESNSSRTGGGIVLRSSAATIDDNDILKNSASSVGGGLEIIGSNVNLVNNRIYSNTANVGGGLQVGSSSGASFTNNVIRYNQAFFNGGGIDFATSGAALVRNNVIADNQASSKGSGALVSNSSPRFEHNTFARNTGGDGTAIHAAGGAGTNVVMTNTIFVTHTLAITVSTGSTVTVKTGLSFGNTSFCGSGAGSCTFTNLHTGNPVFAADGYHVRPGSQAIDNGLVAGVTTDIDGDTRPIGSAPDIGADEFDPTEASGTRYVAKTGTNTSNDCTLTSLPCLTVQYAVDLAKTGEEVRVAAGTYTGVQARPRVDVSASGTVTQVVYITRSVTLGGGYTTTNWTMPNPSGNVTTLDAQNLGRGLYVAGNHTVKVTGFTITRGNAKDQGGQPFLGPSNSAGGGIYAITATATITGNTFTNNDAGVQGAITTKGGGIYLQSVSSGLISGNSLISNTASRGGGVYLSSSPASVSANTILSNSVTNLGGGIVVDNSAATLSHNTVMSNTAPDSSGVYVFSSSNPVLDSNLIMRNKTYGNGAGLSLFLSGGLYTNNIIADNVITDATGSGNGVFVYGSTPRFIHTTLARNSGGDGSGVLIDDNGVGTYSSVVLTNTILVNHSLGISVTAGNTATLNGILFFGNPTNTGGGGTLFSSNTHTGDPAFDTDGYHLTSDSAALDLGISTTVTTDFDGDSRPFGAAPDLGADELAGFLIYLPLIMK